jgi:hypothetical protein
MSNIIRVGFLHAAFVFNTMESSLSEDKGAFFETTELGILIKDVHPERARKRSLFPTVLIPWGNVAYVNFAKEVPVPEKKSKKVAKEGVVSE